MLEVSESWTISLWSNKAPGREDLELVSHLSPDLDRRSAYRHTRQQENTMLLARRKAVSAGAY